MKDNSLRRQLRLLQPPTPSEAARGRAKDRALVAFQHREETAARHGAPSFGRRAWTSVALVLIVGLVMITALRPRSQPEVLAQDRIILREIEQLFPHELNGVVQKDGQTSLLLAPGEKIGRDQPVVLVFKRKDELVRILSFSGRRVCVPLGTQEACFDILATPDGSVILENDHEVIVPSPRASIAGFSLRAQAFSL